MTLRRPTEALGTRILSIPLSSVARMLSVSISTGNSKTRDIGSATCSRWMNLPSSLGSRRRGSVRTTRFWFHGRVRHVLSPSLARVRPVRCLPASPSEDHETRSKMGRPFSPGAGKMGSWPWYFPDGGESRSSGLPARSYRFSHDEPAPTLEEGEAAGSLSELAPPRNSSHPPIIAAAYNTTPRR